jgi:hypothetical protein
MRDWKRKVDAKMEGEGGIGRYGKTASLMEEMGTMKWD